MGNKKNKHKTSTNLISQLVVAKIGGNDFDYYINDGEEGAIHIRMQQKKSCIFAIGGVNTCAKMLKHLLPNK
jgi:hypothetical protein